MNRFEDTSAQKRPAPQAGGASLALADADQPSAPPSATAQRMPASHPPGGAGGMAARVSLSKCHKCNQEEKPRETAEKRWLSGSQAKTAFAVRMNAEKMVESAGLERCGFLTLTVGDFVCLVHGHQLPKGRLGRCPLCRRKMNFCQVHDPAEASRRIHSLSVKLLPALFSKMILVSERHRSKALHFHALGALAAGVDIRTGFDFAAVRHRDYSSVCRWLRECWAMLRDTLPQYGFGRAELLPIRKTSGAVASYVSKYIEKNILHRLPEDRRKKLVRYHGFAKQQLKPNDFEWDSDAARFWRARTLEACALVGVSVRDAVVTPSPELAALVKRGNGRIRVKCFDGSQAAEVLGPRWAYHASNLTHRLGLADGPRLKPDFAARQVLSRELQRLAGRRWCRGMDQVARHECCGLTYTAGQWREMWEGLPLPGSKIGP